MAGASTPTPGAARAHPHRANRIRGPARGLPRPLLLLLAIGALLSVAWNLATPPLQGPDEARHFAYAQYLAETGKLPRPVGAGEEASVSPGSVEAQDALSTLYLRPLISNRRVRPAWSSVDLNLWHEVERSMPHGSRSAGAAVNPLAQNPPLYYAVMAIPYRLFIWLPLLKRIFVLRLFNTLFFLATIALSWMIAREVFGAVRWMQALVSGAVAFLPQMAFMGAVINADNLLIALTTAFVLVCLRLVKRGPSAARTLSAGLLAAAAGLTQGRGLVTVPVLAVVLLLTWLSHRPRARDTLTLAGAAAAPLGVAVIAYALFGKPSGSSSLYGGQVSEFNSKTHFRFGQLLSTIWNFYFERLVRVGKHIGPKWGFRQVFIERFYGGFGAGELTFPRSVIDALQVVSVLGILAVLASVAAGWRLIRRAWPSVFVMVTLLVVTVVFLHYVNYRAVLIRGAGHLFVGRYLLPIVSLFGLAIAFCVSTLPRRLGQAMGAAILAAGAMLCITGIAVSMFSFYG